MPVSELSKHALVNLMIGRDADQLAESYEAGVHLPPRVETNPVLTIDALTAPGDFEDISFTLHEARSSDSSAISARA
ncbi:MAG: hypothetical protein R2848_05330 [Thermomicrobiales bacterium]